MLTNAMAKAAAPQARAYKLHDQGGLFLHVAPSGCRSWRFKFRWRGREQLLVLGRFPDMALPIARARRDAARDQLDRGVDPRSAVDMKVNTFAAMARAWHAHMTPRWSETHAADVLASLERDVVPVIGDRPVDGIAAKELLELLRAIEARGSRETARRVRQRLSAVFGYAMSLDQCDSDPAAKLGGALQGASLVKPHAALTDAADCRALLASCDQFAGADNMIALTGRFLALTAVRFAAVRGMLWDEIEDLDGDCPVWRVPAERMKLTRAKKGDVRFDHPVPLSPAAVAVLAAVRNLHSGNANLHGLVFTGRNDAPIGEGALRRLYDRAGFAGRHVPHGWRASFSTILNEDLGEAWRGDIDRALAHAGMGKVEAAYNRSAQLGRRRTLMQRWAEILTDR